MKPVYQAKRFILWPQFPIIQPAVDIATERYRFIRSEMVRRGITNKSISDAASVSREYVFMVLSGQRKGYRVRLLVAEKCHVPVQTLFPDTPSQYLEAA